MPPEKFILVASRDPHLADVRKHILDEAGYGVVRASNIVEVAKQCAARHIDLVLIGYSLPATEKRRVAEEVRKFSKAPILQLYNQEPVTNDELLSPFYSHHSKTPEDFLTTVNTILNGLR